MALCLINYNRCLPIEVEADWPSTECKLQDGAVFCLEAYLKFRFSLTLQDRLLIDNVRLNLRGLLLFDRLTLLFDLLNLLGGRLHIVQGNYNQLFFCFVFALAAAFLPHIEVWARKEGHKVWGCLLDDGVL